MRAAVAVSIIDLANRYRYIEICGVFERIDLARPAPSTSSWRSPTNAPFGTEAPKDAAERVIFYARPTQTGKR